MVLSKDLQVSQHREDKANPGEAEALRPESSIAAPCVSDYGAFYRIAVGMEKCDRSDFDGAISSCSMVLDTNPQLAAAWATRGRAHYFKGDFKAAIADCRQAVRLNKDLPETWEILANALAKEELTIESCVPVSSSVSVHTMSDSSGDNGSSSRLDDDMSSNASELDMYDPALHFATAEGGHDYPSPKLACSPQKPTLNSKASRRERTKLCMRFLHGICARGDACNLAHCAQGPRAKPPPENVLLQPSTPLSPLQNDHINVSLGDRVLACFYGEWHFASVRRLIPENSSDAEAGDNNHGHVEVLWESEWSTSILPASASHVRPASRPPPPSTPPPPPPQEEAAALAPSWASIVAKPFKRENTATLPPP
jgi:hypothetical protein